MIDLEKANQEALSRLLAAQPLIVGMGRAKETVPGMKDKMLLHAGPPLTWETASGPIRGGVMAACMYEGWAKTPEEAEKLAASGAIAFDPCHHHHAVGPMAGIMSPSMPVFVLENRTHGNKAYVTMNEDSGRCFMGAFGPEVIEHLQWRGTLTLCSTAIEHAVKKVGAGHQEHDRSGASHGRRTIQQGGDVGWFLRTPRRAWWRRARQPRRGLPLHRQDRPLFLNIAMAAGRPLKCTDRRFEHAHRGSAQRHGVRSSGLRSATLVTCEAPCGY